MKQKMRVFLKDWVIPPGFLRIIHKAEHYRNSRSQYGLTKAEISNILSRNEKFNGMYAGRRCFVIANGPSLAKLDLSFLKNDITIVMNLFFRHPILNVWQPTFYCAAEPPTGGWKNVHMIPIMKEGIAKLSPQAFFIPLITKKISEQYFVHPPEKTYYLRMEGAATKDSELDLTKTVPGAPDTSIMAVMLAIALGCSPIYLLGLDYDWLAHRSIHRHFYGENEDTIETREDLGAKSYLKQMESVISCYNAHSKLKDIASHRGQRIYNATEGSFMDEYPLINYSDIKSE